MVDISQMMTNQQAHEKNWRIIEEELKETIEKYRVE